MADHGKIKVIIMGAAGRDFHDFNTFWRNHDRYEVVAFTATQIPDIEGRTYPAQLCGPRYPEGIPIYPEEKLTELIKEHRVDQVSIAKLQSQAEAELSKGNVDKATRLLGHAISGTQRLGHTKATQALTSLQEEVKKTQTLASKAAKTQLLTAQAEVRKTQLLDPEALKGSQRD